MDSLQAEARRVYARYQREVVEAVGLCPWARQAREDGQVRVEVIVDAAPTPEAVLPVVDEVAADEQAAIGILLFPNVSVRRGAWERFHSALRNLDAERFQYGASPMTSAAFHPVGEPDMASGDVLKPFIRRSPDPLIQLVRVSVLKQIRGERTGGTTVLDMNAIAGMDMQALKALTDRPKPVSEAVAEANLRAVEKVGVDALRALLDDIRRDRDEAYARVRATYGGASEGGGPGVGGGGEAVTTTE